jgi:glyoxylase-like metal-dependent hydrolase (beta-lactamase superfamily II)
MKLVKKRVKKLHKITIIFTLFWFYTGTLMASTERVDNSPLLPEFCQSLPRPENLLLDKIAHDSHWFELYQLAPGVTAIYEPYQWQGVISYLIEGNNSALLFDTGNGIGDIAALVHSLTDKPIAVLNSHSHYDHVGGNYQFEKIYGMNTPFGMTSAQGLDNAQVSLEVSPQALCQPLPSGVTQESHTSRPYKITNFVENASIIELGERQLEVIHVPGHTPDAIALIDRQAGLLWTGDTVYSGTLWLHAPETNLKAYGQSLKTLVDLMPNLNTVLPAHNIPWLTPNILTAVESGYNKLLAGQATKVLQADGKAKYFIGDEKRFSFLLTNKPLPTYTK